MRTGLQQPLAVSSVSRPHYRSATVKATGYPDWSTVASWEPIPDV